MQKIVYNTNTEEIDNITMIQYLASEHYLLGKELETAEELIKAFRQQRSLSCGLNYDKLFVDGGKQDPCWEIIIQSNRKWSEFEVLLKNKAKFIEKYLCIEKKVRDYKKELGTNFYDVVGELILIIEKITRLRSSDWELLLIELRNKVKEYGFKKTCRHAKMDFKTLQKILNGNKNINLKSVEKLINFFELYTIKR